MKYFNEEALETPYHLGIARSKGVCEKFSVNADLL